MQSPALTPLPPSPLPPNSKLRPPLDSERKSRILSVCFHSVLALPLLDVLEKHTCLFLEPPNIQVQSWTVVPFREGAPALPATARGLGGGVG